MPGKPDGDPLRALLVDGLRSLALPRALVEPLLDYLQQLQRWNRAYNLTAVRDPAQMVTRHLLDSLALLPAVDLAAATDAAWLDVGSGAGLPGVPLALAKPRWSLTLLDSNGKKARFLRHLRRALGIDNIAVVESRIEAFPAGQPFDFIVSRAFASLDDFLRLTANAGGADTRWLAMKGKLGDQSSEKLPEGFVLESVTPLAVPGLREARHLLTVRRR